MEIDRTEVLEVVRAEYTLKLISPEIKKLRDIVYKVSFLDGPCQEAKIRELTQHKEFARSLMDVIDTYLCEWMEETRRTNEG